MYGQLRQKYKDYVTCEEDTNCCCGPSHCKYIGTIQYYGLMCLRAVCILSIYVFFLCDNTLPPRSLYQSFVDLSFAHLRQIFHKNYSIASDNFMSHFLPGQVLYRTLFLFDYKHFIPSYHENNLVDIISTNYEIEMERAQDEERNRRWKTILLYCIENILPA